MLAKILVLRIDLFFDFNKSQLKVAQIGKQPQCLNEVLASSEFHRIETDESDDWAYLVENLSEKLVLEPFGFQIVDKQLLVFALCGLDDVQ